MKNIDLSNSENVFYANRKDTELNILNYGKNQDMIYVCFLENEQMEESEKDYLMVTNGGILVKIPEKLIGSSEIYIKMQNLSRNEKTKIIKINFPTAKPIILTETKPMSYLQEKQKPIDYLMINEETREIVVPDSEKIFGVESDDKSEDKHFKCKRFIDNSLDLSQMVIRINWKNANGEMGQFVAENVSVDGEFVTFTWLLSRNVTAYKGIVQFIVCATKTNYEGTITNEWNTTLCEGSVLQGLEVTETTPEQPPTDVLGQLLQMITENKNNITEINSALCWQ